MNGIQNTADIDEEIVEAVTEFYDTYARDAIADVAQGDGDAIHIDWRELYQYEPVLAEDFVHNPKQVLPSFRFALHEYNVPVPSVEAQLEQLDVRVHGVDTPEEIVSNLRDEHRGKYMGVRGQVSLATQVKPKLMNAMFRCEKCSGQNEVTVGPIPQRRGDGLDIPLECPGCENQGPFSLKESECEYLDHQIVELTDPPGENPGQSGNVVAVHLYGDAAGVVNPGDRVRINGILDTEPIQVSGNGKKAKRRKDWYLRGHAIDEEEKAFKDVEPERVDKIKEIASRDNTKELFVESFAPDILTGDRGDMHKLAAMLSLFGGHSTNGRDDINLFYIGAPGTGKSAYLKRAKELAPKAVEASGKGATAAGLTATATKSETTGKWMLEAGALVLASGGVACIDEFDKMADSVRQSMHEAMENQQVPINKAGINTTLTTETTVIAAANPQQGSFNRFDALADQVKIGSPLLSRFDLIFGVADSVHEDRDAAIAAHQHERTTSPNSGPLEDELITEYIAYARQNVQPVYESEEPKNRLVEYYTEKRQESNNEDDESVTPVTPRMNDALRRLAQASARMHLREKITVADAKVAIELMDMTLGDTALEPDGSLNNARMEGRTMTQKERRNLIPKVVSEEKMTIAEIADEIDVDEETVQHDVEHLSHKGELYEPQTNKYKQV